MKRFILALFSVVALLALVAPSPVNALRRAGRETNAERLARGLPPNPPTRRSTAPQRRASLTPYVIFFLGPLRCLSRYWMLFTDSIPDFDVVANISKSVT